MISTDYIVDRIIHSDQRTVAQAISIVENNAKVSFDFWNSEGAAYLLEHIETVFSRSHAPCNVVQKLILHFKQL